jgi:ABC-type Co2+ transport system permease subunit
MFSWFNSSDQIDTALVFVAVIGAVIELGVAIAAIINVHKEIEESRKKKLEKYIEIFACVAAFFFLTEAILGWRSSLLHPIGFPVE